MTLNWWESFIIGAAVTFLSSLEAKVTNPIELAALKTAIQFLQTLLNGTGLKSYKP